MSDPVDKFDDPALKAAIRKAIGNETAPASLRNRVSAALRREAAPPFWLSRRVRAYALAACMIIGIGLLAVMLLPRKEPPVPDWFADAMISTHDTCKTLTNHALLADVSITDLPALRQRLQELLGHPALVAMLDDGWAFKGAGTCQVRDVPAAHLLFSRGQDTISIFSISAKLLYSNASSDGMTYSQTRNGHELAGFVYGGAIHCLVGESPTKKVSLRQVIDLRDRFLKAPIIGFGTERLPLKIAH